jgi:hypothetical protein
MTGGQFPHGKLNEHDEGALRLDVAADVENGVVLMHFGKPVAWLGLTADVALELASALIAKAQDVEAVARDRVRVAAICAHCRAVVENAAAHMCPRKGEVQ